MFCARTISVSVPLSLTQQVELVSAVAETWGNPPAGSGGGCKEGLPGTALALGQVRGDGARDIIGVVGDDGIAPPGGAEVGADEGQWIRVGGGGHGADDEGPRLV